MHVSNMYYNDALEKAGVRDLSGAIVSLRHSLKFNKNNIEARNLLGLVYYETGEVMNALSEWVLSKNMQPERNIADDYINKVQSNTGKLNTINQAIKKYNVALQFCRQGSKDLARIQLRKVVMMNPRFVCAHQLLALVYMDQEDWEGAERELRKCVEIDRNNARTLRYLKEVEQRLMPDEQARQPAKRRKEEAVRYQSENEVIIQPLNVKEPKRSGVSTLLNIGFGIVIGVAAAAFLVVPGAQSAVRSEMQETITKISSESDAKTANIQELEGRIAGLNGDIEELRRQVEGFVGENGTLQTMEGMLDCASAYISTGDIHAAADDLESIAGNINLEEMTEGFRRLYQEIFNAIGPELAEEYYKAGTDFYRTQEYEAAIAEFERAVSYDAGNVEALFYLGQAYRMNEDRENAILAYDKLLELFPDSSRARTARQQRDALAAAAGAD